MIIILFSFFGILIYYLFYTISSSELYAKAFNSTVIVGGL